ncbi:MAG: peptidoglycan recognition protein family protein [Actinomycetia bacterium]|nr:peptidoglycan recognition protein family protein [Actinomycetes bacterium]
MCNQCFSRREVLVRGSLGIAAAGLVSALGRSAHADSPSTPQVFAAVDPVNVAPGLDIFPRAAWGADLLPVGPIITPEDVRFLLVHHTASPNKPDKGGTPTTLRKTFAFQTGKGKGWPDVCYEFFVDRDGLVWEGRTGALDGPVVADATGGSQGFAQLVCLIGDFTRVLPTAAQQAGLVRTLAWLADRYAIDTTPGATTSFVSRGSNRFRRGANVTVKTISGHRDTSKTSCPGNKFYPVVRDQMQALVTAEREQMWLARNGGFPFAPSETASAPTA